ncbi:polysaccharide deacetylase family protein [Dyadobacter arcticus]|uniref:Peptidoglycan/xylan/chitin deacetylase (PgdA/CDA1 family) n=1 Tax=Dyadobacter arcticus TaxID=1078754 RepID=A0ABX0UQ52_9BACT|nr:polysaccharide deacetylase family protein [Dyadobacter arcticus]NIJ55133.1 peptidoglycan/xylan/chitin deacetylase (PgdA/CDA1 family) [Dyadobacter arcticus]
MKHNLVTFVSITVLALSGIIFWETDFLLPVSILIILLYLGVTAYGSFKIQANYFLKSINQGKTKSIALTFDDGPNPNTTPRILEVLKQKNIKAAFFVIGKNAALYPDILKQIHNDGHTIGNHSFSHHHLIGFFSSKKLKGDLAHCNEVIRDVIGKTPLFFRPPFGVTNPRYASVLNDLQLTPIGWSLRSLDTRAKSKYKIINKIISELKSRDIVLLHDHLKVTADSLEDVIEHCLQKGVKIVPLHQLIQKEPYDQN